MMPQQTMKGTISTKTEKEYKITEKVSADFLFRQLIDHMYKFSIIGSSSKMGRQLRFVLSSYHTDSLTKMRVELMHPLRVAHEDAKTNTNLVHEVVSCTLPGQAGLELLGGL